MKPYKKYFENEQLYTVDKYNNTYVHKKLRKGDIIPIYMYDRKKIYYFIILSIRKLNNKDQWLIKKELIDYIIEIKVKKGGSTIYETPVLKNGEVRIDLRPITYNPHITSREKFMTKYGMIK